MQHDAEIPVSFQVNDGYAHCGVSKYRAVEEVRHVMARFNVGRTVLVQHLGEYDNSYIERIVTADPETFAGVLLVDPEDPDAMKQLDHWCLGGHFRGVRFLASTLQTHPRLWERAAQLGLNLVIYDEPTLAVSSQLLARFAKEHPETNVVISHLGMLDPSEAPSYSSHKEIRALGNWPNVFVQLSGFHMFAKPPYQQLVPVVEALVEAFGPQRLYYGSNYPVMEDDDIYRREIELLCRGQLGVPAGEIDLVMGENVQRLWFD